MSVMFGLYVRKSQKTVILLGDTDITVTIADTAKAREDGLGNKETLGAKEGMLFVFNEAQLYGFWMKDMRFPIDIIWFNADHQVVFVKEHAEPASYPEVFTPIVPAMFVLEVPAGFFEQHQLKIGDTFKIRR